MHALCLPLGASISLLIMFFFFDSMQLLFAVCTASECDSVYLKTPLNLFPLLLCSHCNGGIGLSAAANVPVHHTPLHGRQTLLIWHLWTIYGSGAIQFHALRLHCVRLGTHWTLAFNGWLVQIDLSFTWLITLRFLLQPWEWACVWPSLRLCACPVWRCRRCCWPACWSTTSFGCSSHRTYSAQMWWSRWPHDPPIIQLELWRANWIWAALCGTHPSWICLENWYFPAFTILGISRCSAWAMWLCRDCCCALSCAMMRIRSRRALPRIQRCRRQRGLALGWHIFIVPYWGKCSAKFPAWYR